MKKFLEEEENVKTKHHLLKLNYDSYDYHQTITLLLGEEIEAPKIFEVIGHIGIFNLTPEQYLFKKQIGRVYLDKNPHVKTILNRTYDFSNKVFTTEFVEGDENPNTVFKQDSLFLHLNCLLSQFTTRLEEQRTHLLSHINMNYTICDLMADSGFFTMKAALKGANVISANEKESLKEALEKNITRNEVQDKVLSFQKSPEEMIKYMFHQTKQLPKKFQKISLIYIGEFFQPLKYLSQILSQMKEECKNLLSSWNTQLMPKVFFYFIDPDAQNAKKNLMEQINKLFQELNCAEFTDKFLISFETNRFIFRDTCLHSVLIKIPPESVLEENFLELYHENLQSFIDYNISQTLDMIDESKELTFENSIVSSSLSKKRKQKEKEENTENKTEEIKVIF